MVMSRHVILKNNYMVNGYCFKHADKFKYPQANINEKNNMHKGNQSRKERCSQ